MLQFVLFFLRTQTGEPSTHYPCRRTHLAHMTGNMGDQGQAAEDEQVSVSIVILGRLASARLRAGFNTTRGGGGGPEIENG